jgi:hypothetical protein
MIIVDDASPLVVWPGVDRRSADATREFAAALHSPYGWRGEGHEALNLGPEDQFVGKECAALFFSRAYFSLEHEHHLFQVASHIDNLFQEVRLFILRNS